jgi:hypothetical protein
MHVLPAALPLLHRVQLTDYACIYPRPLPVYCS